MKGFIIWLASVSYSGYFPWGPGTAGTLLGIPVYLLFSTFPAPLYLLSTAALFFLACWAAARAEEILGRKDSPVIVIDEVVGFLITMALIPPTPAAVTGGFLFFRLFDIIKISPAGAIDQRMKGGLAVVLDDAVVGVYANILLQAITHWVPHLLAIIDQWFLG